MIDTISLRETGGPAVLRLERCVEQRPGLGQVWLEQRAVGVNYLDVTQRNGAVSIPLPSGIGLEGAGRVEKVGADVTNVAVGDRVAYATGPIGAYASARLFPADRLVKIPDSLSYDAAAAVMFKGITAQYLLKSTFRVAPGHVVLMYGVAGGLGQIMARWAKSLGAFVIGVVSKEKSVGIAKAAGCDEVIVFDAATLASEVGRITDGRKADVVYDPIGRISFASSRDSLRARGMMVSFGASSGAPKPVELGTLNSKGSLFLTRPSLAAHTSTSQEYLERALDVLACVASGAIVPRVAGKYPLSEASKAHADLEGGRAGGALVLNP